jgi:MFS family permease
MTSTSARTWDGRRWRVLGVLCLAVFAINLDSTLVNVTLPTLVRELDASTSQLQWVVDAYNLAFAALVLAAMRAAGRAVARQTIWPSVLRAGRRPVAIVLGPPQRTAAATTALAKVAQ